MSGPALGQSWIKDSSAHHPRSLCSIGAQRADACTGKLLFPMPKKTTIVTAIPYVNSAPHIDTLLTDIAGDITARYVRMRGDDVFFVGETAENGAKIKDAAEKAGE